MNAVDSCRRRFTGTLNRAKVFEAAIKRVLQQSDSAASDNTDSAVNMPVTGVSVSLDDSRDTAVHTGVSIQPDESRDTAVHTGVSVSRDDSRDTAVHTGVSIQPDDSRDTAVHTGVSIQLHDSRDTAVHTGVSIQPHESMSRDVSSDGRVTLILNCAALAHSSIRDMTATCLRQILVSQHVHNLLTSARSVLQMTFLTATV